MKEDMTECDVSVIIPCYNAQKYLKQAIQSAEQSNQVTIEFLLINDGSTDDSEKIAKKLAERDTRIRIINKENGGYGSAMNRGIKEALGKYIAVLEPDDWVAPAMYDNLFGFAAKYAKKERGVWPDIVKSSYWRVVMPDTSEEKEYLCAYAHRIQVSHQPFVLSEQPRMVAHHPSIWSALYRRTFILENNIWFKEIPGAGWVDNPFLFETMLSAKSIIYLDKPYYHYREDLPGSSSATKTAALGLERWQDMADVCDAHHVSNQGILEALYTIAARYVFDAIDKDALNDAKLVREIKKIASRIDLSILLNMDNLSPAVKRFFYEQAGKKPPRIKRFPYIKNLVREFFYSWQTNGLSFALSRIGLFNARKTVEKKSEKK